MIIECYFILSCSQLYAVGGAALQRRRAGGLLLRLVWPQALSLLICFCLVVAGCVFGLGIYIQQMQRPGILGRSLWKRRFS